MGKITNRELEALTAEDGGRILREDGGIVGRVRAGTRGLTVSFRYEYKLDGSKRDHALGSWPKKSLANIRAERDRVRVTAAQGIDPTAAKKAARIEKQKAIATTLAEAERDRVQVLTVQDLFDLWIVEGINRKDGNKEVARMFKRDILPHIGTTPLRRLTESALRAVLRTAIGAGTVSKAAHMLLGVKQMLAWAEKRQPWRALLVDGNPADLISEDSILPPDYEEERTRVLLPDEIRELHDIFVNMTANYEAATAGTKYQHERPLKKESQLAIWISLGTLCRIGELLMAKWEHVDLEAGTWFIPKENVQGRRGKKQDHHVWLSTFVLRQFRALFTLTGKTAWCFPARHMAETHVCVSSVSKQIGDRQERFMERKSLKNRKHNNTLVLGGGKNGNWTAHDLRRTGATMMQSLGVSLEAIDRCQNHVIQGSKVRRHYLHYDYDKEKASAWNKLGERLEEILTWKSQGTHSDLALMTA
ncbi:tyrosine-type recombinase/integrase [Achromobacter insuavis]|uniref:tyrosine-type recombinase/integrase n=1 Tax=Achromobacter insuavis TaxID=1287735 RepID=UPI001F14022C|nr:site-specific integrase [Achromobacter insuavis]